MTRPILADAFAHHVWATDKILEACEKLEPDQLGTNVPGTYGSILETLRHTGGADASYLALLSDGKVAEVDEYTMDIPALRAEMRELGPVWQWLLTQDLDPDQDIVRHREDGSTSTAPLGVRLAQVIHHGTDHRSQVCTALTTLGIEPPEIDVWSWASEQGMLSDTPPTT
ncbi:MAG: DinB family protein [Chloroflexota bacterium]